MKNKKNLSLSSLKPKRERVKMPLNPKPRALYKAVWRPSPIPSMTTRQRNNEMISTVAGGVITHVKDDARADTAGWKVWKIVILKWKKKRRNCFGGGGTDSLISQKMGERRLHSNTLVNGDLPSSHCISTNIQKKKKKK